MRGLTRYVVPGLVIQAVLVGGGYATGRELVEFFLSVNPASGLIGMALTALLFSVGAMIAFELARSAGAFDYNSLMGLLLGRFRWLFEIGYIAALILSLAVVSAAASELLAELAGMPHWLSASLFMAIVAGLVFFGNTLIERVISAWSIIFYIAYGAMFVLVVAQFGPDMAHALGAESVDAGPALWNGVSYTAYNITILPVLIFVARDFASRREALWAGAIAGPLILFPGFAFLLTLSAFYPEVKASALPVSYVLDRVDSPALSLVIRLVIFGALLKTGVGLLHGFNERLARTGLDRGRPLPKAARPAIAIALIILAGYAATAIGLIELIGTGYRYSAAYFLVVLVLPLLTVGLYRLFRGGPELRPAE